jgi:hypothetical protein
MSPSRTTSRFALGKTTPKRLGFLVRLEVAAAAIAGVATCGPADRWPGNAPVPVRPELELRTATRAAELWWNRAAGWPLFAPAYDGEDAVSVRVDVDGALQRYIEADATPTLVRARTGATAATIAHELGHVLGLHHDAEPNSVMRDGGCDKLEAWCAVPAWQMADVIRWYR